METIKIKIDWSDHNFGAVTECEALDGIVIATAKTYDMLMEELSKAIQEHIASMEHDGETVPDRGWYPSHRTGIFISCMTIV